MEMTKHFLVRFNVASQIIPNSGTIAELGTFCSIGYISRIEHVFMLLSIKITSKEIYMPQINVSLSLTK